MKKRLWSVVILALGTAWCRADYEVQKSVTARHAKTGVTVIAGTVELPTGDDWYLKESLQRVGGLSDIVLLPPDAAFTLRKGRRTRMIEEERLRKHNRGRLQSLYWSLRRYATEHEGVAPVSLDALNRSQWSNEVARATFHYIPGLKLLDRKATNRWVNASTNALVAFELKPAVDDGKHWVLRSGGAVRHEAIDAALLEQYSVELTPGAKPVQEQLKAIPKALTYQIMAQRRDAADGHVTLELMNSGSDAVHALKWDYTAAAEAERDIAKEWARIRMWSLNAMDQGDGASVLTYWIGALANQYGLKVPDRPQPGGRRRRRRERQTSLFNVLGGRAAIRETLQLQSIGGRASMPASNRIDVTTLKGVTVKSHPFKEMLGDAEGGRLALADLAPPDRLFAYFAKPEALLQMMDGGTDFIFRGGASATGRSLEYGMTARYLGKLGVSEQWVRGLLKSGVIEEMAVMLPDLFLVDGTDLTVVSRLKNPRLAAASLKMLGLSSLKGIVARKADDWSDVFWTQRDDLLLISTQRAELDRVLALLADPAESLGQSAEFRYMLSRQPLNERTRATVYFSDPFVRRLVGPAAKIGQLRRLQARAEMEAITAGNLLYQADGHGGKATLEVLVEKGYVRQPVRVRDAVLDAGGRVASEQFGTLTQMATLLASPVALVSDREAKAYRTYVDGYNRFWRRFFDPIGIRFDQTSAKEMALSIFILPLIDNSLYAGLRQALIAGENAAPLPLPELDPAPVATLSFNLNEKAWMEVVENMDDLLEQMLGIGPDILDNLGPDVHIAMGDADPIIGLGSGELTALAGLTGGGMSDEMFMIPMVVSMLTRPCVLMVGLDDPAAVRAKLGRMATGTLSGRRMFLDAGGSLYKLAERDAWHYVVSIGGMLNLRFGLEIKDRYLVISNLPLTHDPAVRSWREAPHNAAAMVLNPAACLQQLPALFTSASSRQRAAAMGGLGGLYPMLRSGSGDVPQAIARHRRLFGFTPLHPGRGEWQWDGNRLSSTVFGYPGREEQPAYRADDKAYGVFQGVGTVGLSMQFEDDGLRSHCRWVLEE
ncbi:MAG: hypothetical protein HN383_06060 [Verrucomicrobia bacterium]|jgi:hypothetical protein|nr:hypothetical protein [Verrucomicrobiota bacterium]MBT7699344.1 hypothetical protein [Verrucomicrobiota bacterium]